MEPVPSDMRIPPRVRIVNTVSRLVEHAIYWIAAVLLVLLLIVVVAGTLDVIVRIGTEFQILPRGRMDVTQILSLLGLFLVVLISIELLYVVRLYLEGRHFDVETILIVALIAIARKVIVFDIEKNDTSLMLGLAAVILSLSGALALLRKFPRSSPSWERD